MTDDVYPATATYYDEEHKIWSGRKQKDLYGPDMTIGEIALFILKQNPEKVIQVMDTTGEEMTAAQLIKYSKLMAKNFMRFGFKIGDVVGICANNATHLASVQIGAFLCGMPTNALYPGFDKDTISVVFKVTTPVIVFCDVENYNVMKAVVEELHLNVDIFLANGDIVGVHNVKELLVDVGSDMENMRFPCENITGDDTAIIQCSSGTTGPPKGALCSHKALLNRQVFNHLHSDSVLFTFSTLYWASGSWTFTAAILNGVKRIITDQQFTPEYFLQLVEKYGITDVLTGPHHMAQIIQNTQPNTAQRLASIRSILCGGSKVAQVISEKLNAILDVNSDPATKVGLTTVYGMSELSSMVSANDGGPQRRREGTEGQLMPNCEARIINEEGKQVGVNTPGILNIRTPHKWRGYYRNPEATQKASAGDWFITSDIGYFDADGFLHICTRESDVFKSNAFQIYPEQIEEVIMQLAGVLEVCVFGVPDFVAGKLTACAIVRTDNAEGRRIAVSDVEEHVALKMSTIYHIKAGVYFVNALPKTGSGKVLRRKVWDMIQQRVNE